MNPLRSLVTKEFIRKALASLVLLLVGAGVGSFVGIEYEKGILFKDLSIIHPIRDHNSSYKLIAPLLAYVIPSADQDIDLVALKDTVLDYVNGEKSHGLANASMFFYDLNEGRWIGVNEREKYDPASMLKVVVMVSYFKKSESDASILNKELTYTQNLDTLIRQDIFNSVPTLEINKTYTVEKLIEKMIIDSDNGAEILLLNNIDKTSLDAVYNALNIDNPDSASSNFVISPRAYSLFFRILYSSTYLDNDLSEKAMGILSKTTFKHGIVAGLPQDMTAAHKFGEHINISNNKIQNIELHDCGIIYYPENPYLLCVMTRGNNLDELKSVIKNISHTVYQKYTDYK